MEMATRKRAIDAIADRIKTIAMATRVENAKSATTTKTISSGQRVANDR
jgi:hypothetical protein